MARSRGLGDVYKRQVQDHYIMVTGMVCNPLIYVRILLFKIIKLKNIDPNDLKNCSGFFM
jgi:hypothetical protein